MSGKELVAVDPIKGILLTEKYEPFVGEMDYKGIGVRQGIGVALIAVPFLLLFGSLAYELDYLLTTTLILFFPMSITGSVIGVYSEDFAEKRLWRNYCKWLESQGFSVKENGLKYTSTSPAQSGTMAKIDGSKYVVKTVKVDGEYRSTYEPVEKPKPKLIPAKNKWGLLQSFTATGQEITDSIHEQAKHLLSFSLSIEDRHAVERILFDMNELNKLGGMTEGSEPNKLYMKTLKTLQKEIKAVASQVNANMVRQLKIHASYVEKRNQVTPEFNLSQNHKVIS
jgi:hypothetical protein